MDSDALVYTAIFGDGSRVEPGMTEEEARQKIREQAREKGIIPSSIYDFYHAIGTGKVIPRFTVPAINIRTLTYDTAQIVFGLIKKHTIGPVIFEIARSEMEYTTQSPDEYATVILAAALQTGYSGPVYLQGDHFQLSAKKYKEDKEKEVQRIKDLIDSSIAAGFYNIDIDASTLVNVEKESLEEQQGENYAVTAELVKYIREKEKEIATSGQGGTRNDDGTGSRVEPGMTISVGAEIGHIGGKNSTVEDLQAFMHGFLPLIGTMIGISKMSVQTGTSHGGIVDALGKVESVKLDLSILESIGKVAKEAYHLAGTVQHGASTLPLQLFDKFPKNNCIEIHLATGFQNIVFDTMPKILQENMYAWVVENLSEEREKNMTDQQFIYKMRKKALGPFKKQLWDLAAAEKKPIMEALEKHLEETFERLGVFNTRELY